VAHIETAQDRNRGVALTPALWDSFLSGNRQACARIITKVENDPSSIPEVREKLVGRIGKAVRIGITGPPGVGKSTLSSAVALGLANRGHKVGVIAVDPTSPFTGGAFMGDRIRMEKFVGDDRIYMRSLASRDGHGGLSPATPHVADVVEGFDRDRILIETVGVGQAELDVLNCTDLVVLVLQPSTGDAIQSLKAGIIEIADLIVVNKSDLPGTDTVLQSLRFVYSLGGPNSRPAPPILPVSCQKGEGIEELLEEIEKLSATLIESGRHQELRKKRLKSEIREAIQECLWKRYLDAGDAETGIERTAQELVQNGGSPYGYVREACAKIELKLKKEA